ncbi:hypothetical protein [Acidovorax sp. sic0104]|uniref:hypothetical protein n=1 Tax=Acidovorax sp. sic0104 TaxID=2854784 RepID=UPI001C44B320|nr:hypothetical protein [Acidovorax sp. sic0104]MBV7542000.1 hypothetical protein [Acidovorax sp. sic0104]
MIEAYFDNLLAGTPFRGLIIQGGAGYCAYDGVPLDHWMAGMDELVLRVHGSITFQGAGDGLYRPEGWYFWGWDYQHWGDQKVLDPALLDLLPPEFRERMVSANSKGKKWTLPEIQQDLIDAAVELHVLVQEHERAACEVLAVPRLG